MKRRNNSAVRKRIATLVGGGIIGSLAFSTAVFALDAPLIMEVQPMPPDYPSQLVIYGRNFGDDPDFTFGTGRIGNYNGYLTAAADQSACSTIPAPPLDNTIPGYSCFVADLSDAEIPKGDYLLEIWAVGPPECTSKPTYLEFAYFPADCSGSNSQAASCSGSMAGSGVNADFTTEGNNNATWSPESGSLSFAGDSVTFSAGDNGKWANNLAVNFDDGSNTQSISLHTSCSQPLQLGDVFGSFTLVDMNLEAMENTKQHDEYDLTLGAVGPMGPQGDPGVAGPAGPAGPDGAAGADGSNGSNGADGATGAAGPAGPAGPAGATGPQGDTGPQGLTGLKGDTGANGATGTQGETGPQGVTGDSGRRLLCFSTDQTIGTSGKYMGLGQQGGSHDGVSVITPFAAGSIVSKFIVKAAQGNQARTGQAQVFHDNPNSVNGMALSGVCDLPGTPGKSVCSMSLNGLLTDQDSLSIFIKADNGSFVSASACVLIESNGVFTDVP